MMEERTSRAQRWRSVDTTVRLCVCFRGIWEEAFSNPGLSLITPLTHQEALVVPLTS